MPFGLHDSTVLTSAEPGVARVLWVRAGVGSGHWIGERPAAVPRQWICVSFHAAMGSLKYHAPNWDPGSDFSYRVGVAGQACLIRHRRF